MVDTNVVLDLLLARKGFVGPATVVFGMIERSELEACLCATTVTTIDYLLNRSLPTKQARQAIRYLLELFEIAPVNRPVLEEALDSHIADFEDAVLEQAARLVGVEAIITRNTKDFRKTSIRALDPAEFLATLQQ
jgi:predicted nucleic acid-binding protein